MVVTSKKVIIGLAITAFSTLAAPAAFAQPAAQDEFTNPAIEPVSIPDQLEAAFFSNDRTFYQNRTLPRQVSYIFGPGKIIRDSFPENEMVRDGAAVNTFYREVVRRQTSSPLIRTVDLVQPFNTSVRTLPTPEQPSSISVEPPAQIAPAAPLPPQKERVPALW